MRSPSSTPLTPIKRRCSHILLSTMFKACCFVLVGEKIIIITIKNANREKYLSPPLYACVSKNALCSVKSVSSELAYLKVTEVGSVNLVI